MLRVAIIVDNIVENIIVIEEDNMDMLSETQGIPPPVASTKPDSGKESMNERSRFLKQASP